MRILVIGAGATGGYIGGLLSCAGHDVVFAVRPAAASALLESGLELQGPRGDFRCTQFRVLSDPADSGDSFDIAISCVKLYDAESSARYWAPLLARSAAVVSFQNGIDGRTRVSAGSGLPNVYGGLVHVAAKVAAPGRIHYQSDMSSLTFGGPGAMQDNGLARFQEAVTAVGEWTSFRATRVDDIASAQWQKFCGLATNAALTCLVRKPAGVVYHDVDLLELAEQSIAEVMAVGTACGACFPINHGDATLQMLKSFPADMFASMHHDLSAGKRLELEGLSGAIVRLGNVHKIQTPFHAFAFACLKPYVDGSSLRG